MSSKDTKMLMSVGVILAIVLILVAYFSLQGGQREIERVSAPPMSKTSPTPDPTDGQLGGLLAGSDLNKTEMESAPNTYFVESEIFNEDGIVIKISNPVGTKSFDLRVENNNDYEISYFIYNMAINNYQVSYSSTGIRILPDRAAENSYEFYGLELTDAAEIETVDLDIRISKFENEVIYGADERHLIHAETSEYDGRLISYSCPGNAIYDDDNIAIYVGQNGVDLQDIYFVYHNKTDKCVFVSSENAVINDLMASDWYSLWTDLLPNSYYDQSHPTGTVTLWSAFDDTVAEKEINPVQEVIVMFRIQPEGQKAYTTDEITVYSVKQ